MTTTIAWQNAPLHDRLEVYDAYCANFDGFGFTDEPEPFEDFDRSMRFNTFKYVKAMYMGA